MALSQQEEKRLAKLETEISGLSQQEEKRLALLEAQISAEGESSPGVAFNGPKGLTKEAAQEINFIQALLPKSDIVALATKFIGQKAFGQEDFQGFGFMGANSSLEATRRAVNMVLEESGVAAESVLIDGSFYLRDKNSGDLYLTTSSGNPKEALAVVNDLLPLIGVVAGAGAAIIATGGAAAAPLAFGSLAGGALGSGAGKVSREVAEKSGPGEFSRDVVGATLGEGATDVIFGGVMQVGGKILKVASKLKNVVKFIPGSSKLGAYVNSQASRLGQLAEPITKPIVDKAGKVSKAVGTTLAPLKSNFNKASEAFMNGEWVKNIQGSQAAKQFSNFAAQLEQTNIGSFILGVDKKILDTAAGGATNGTTKGQDTLESMIKNLQEKSREIAVKIQKEMDNITTLKKLETAGQEKILGLGSKQNAEQVGNQLNGKIKTLVPQKVSKIMKGFNDMLNAELEAAGVTGRVGNSQTNLFDMKQGIDNSTKQAADIIDNEITVLQKRGEEFGFAVKEQELLEKEAFIDSSFSNQKADIETSFAEKANIEDFTEQELQELARNQQQVINESTQEFQRKINDPAYEPQVVGQELQDAVITKWKERIAKEQELYKESLALAETDSTSIDITNYLKGFADDIASLRLDNIDGFVAKITNIVPNPSSATSRELLDLKKFFDQIMGDPEGTNKALYSVVADNRAKLVSDADNVFSKSGSPSLATYQEASAKRIDRYDSFQDRDFANFIGAGAELSRKLKPATTGTDLTTATFKQGKGDRNLETSKNVFDNFVQLVEEDVEAATKILNFAGKGTFFNKRVANAYIKDTVTKTGGDFVKASKRLNTLGGNVGDVNKKFLFDIGGGGSEELDLLQGIAGFTDTKIPGKASEVPAFKRKLQTLQKDSRVRTITRQEEKSKQSFEGKRRLLEAEKNKLKTVDEPIRNLKKLTEKVKGLNVKDIPDDEIRQLAAGFEELFAGGIGSKTGLPLAEDFRGLVKSNPQAIGKIFDELSIPGEQRTEFMRALFVPQKGITTPLETIKGADFFNTFRETANSPSVGAARFAGFGPQEPVEEVVTEFSKLAKTQAELPERERALEVLQRQQSGVEQNLASQTSRLEGSSATRALGAGIGAAAGIAFPGGGMIGDLVGGGLGAVLGANPAIRRSIVGAGQKLAKGVDSGAGLFADIAVPLEARLAAKLTEAATAIPPEGSQEVIGDQLVRNAKFTQPEEGLTEEELLRKILQASGGLKLGAV